ncbi:MAG: YheT family hydrolase [Opitutales bacterium]
MPVLIHSTYRPPLAFRNRHLQTIFPALFRKPPQATPERERITTPDGDFLDLEWARRKPSPRLAVLTHGLEGSSQATYIQGMARALVRAGWNVLAWNFRGCSGEPNRRLQSYHSGATGELQIVLDHALAHHDYDSITLVGFSLGGNLTLKYIGDAGARIDPRIRAAAAFSVPCDLADSAHRLEASGNRVYMHRFLKSLRAKISEKIRRFPGQIEDHGLAAMRTFAEFDDAYTAPIHGFASARDYWTQCSCRHVLHRIQIPTLLVNARDDPFLTPSCFPTEIAREHPHFHLETPAHGGHMGFVQFNRAGLYWSEQRTIEFLKS